MNFYKRFIGDIQAKTGGLTLAEFGAYDRLLDHYYSTEQPVPADEVYRICRAMSGSEKAAVDKVLTKFFELGESGWSQSKADEVIAKALPLIEAARENGKKGGRPRKTENPTETQSVSTENLEGTQKEPSAKAIQSQSQISPNGEKKTGRKALSVAKPDDASEEVWGDFLATRKGALTATGLRGIRREADKAGMSLEEALSVSCERGWKSFKAEWMRDRQRPANKHTAAAAGIFGQPNQAEVIDV